MTCLLDNFEKHIDLGPTSAARLLGYPYSTYAQYKNGRRNISTYLALHVQAVMLLPNDTLQSLIQEVVFSGRDETQG